MGNSLQLVLVRHGETEWTERGLLHGRLDSPLSATGRRHAQLTAERLKGEKFDALISSSRGRALETATFIGQAIGLTPEPEDGLSEMYYGWLEGKPLSLADPDGTGARLFRPFVYFLMALTAERPGKFAERVAAAIDDLRSRYSKGRILIVTHWGVLSMMMAHLIDGDFRGWRSFGPWTACGISELHSVNGSWQTASLNDGQHLEKGKQS